MKGKVKIDGRKQKRGEGTGTACGRFRDTPGSEGCHASAERRGAASCWRETGEAGGNDGGPSPPAEFQAGIREK